MADSWLTWGIGEECGIRQRRGRTLTEAHGPRRQGGRHRDGEELACGGERIVRAPRVSTSLVDQSQPTPGILLLAQRSQGDVTDVPSQNVRLVGLVDDAPLNVEVR